LEALFDDEFAAIWFEPRLEAMTQREAAAVVEVTNTAGGARVLDVPCGFGRRCAALARLGHTCVGVGFTGAHVEMARQTAETSGVASKCSFLVGDIRQLPAVGIADFVGGFDLALSLVSSFGYFAEEADDMAVLRGYCEALRTGGALVIDTPCKETLLAKSNPCLAYRRDETLVVEEREYDILTARLRSHWTLVRDDAVVRRASMNLRLYSMREWLQMLDDTGFGNIEVLDGLPGRPFRLGTSGRSVLVARKL